MIKKFSCETCKNRLCTRNIPLFKSLSDSNLEKITKLKKHIHFEKGDFLFSEGDELTKLYIINSGTIKLTKTTVDGKERITDILTEGDFCGESNILSTSVKSLNNAIAIKETDVCIIEKKELDTL
ncbi:MAG: Crp/Fnr family transcriptional regulator, partial [Sarcina sp.]